MHIFNSFIMKNFNLNFMKLNKQKIIIARIYINFNKL